MPHPMTPSEPKSLILIVAYNAEAHLKSVFRRIPYESLPTIREKTSISGSKD